MDESVEDPERSGERSSERERPLLGYVTLSGVFVASVAAFSTWLRATGRELPERVPPGDLALLTLATHKASRMIAKDRVTSSVRAPFTSFEGDAGAGEVSEGARGTGIRRAVGELLVCPYCLSVWIATALAAGLVVAPRPTRWAATVLSAVFGSDMLQIAYRRAEDGA